MRKTCRLLLLFVGLLTVAGCNMAPLMANERFKVSATGDRVEAAVKRALAHRGWMITEEKPGEILATLFVRAHKAVVRIHYSSDEVTIQYVDSENLKYTRFDDGEVMIHHNYNTWVQNLARDINVFLQA